MFKLQEYFGNKKITIKAVILTVITITAFWLDINISTVKPFSVLRNIFLFKGISVWYFIFTAVLFLFYIYTEAKCKKFLKMKIFTVAVSLLFALFLLVGESFESAESLNPIIHGIRNGQTIKSGICFVGFFILMYNVTAFIFVKGESIFSGIKKCRLPLIGRYGEWLRKKTFLTVFITLCIAYIPYAVASYPGIFLGDEVAQIYQGHSELGIVDPWYFEGRLLDPNVYYNNNHPIVHTLLINLFIDSGVKIFHSGNAGVFAYTLTQMMVMILSVAFVCRYMVKKLKASQWLVFLLVLYYAISPRIQNYMMVTTKDIYYSLFLTYFLVFLFSLNMGKRSISVFVGLILSGLGIFLFRNEGRYILILAFVLLLIFSFKKNKFAAVSGIVSVIAFTALFTNVILPAARVTPGSIRETFSIPFQQTARYLRDEGNNVTQEEKEAISRVLPFDRIAQNYDPNRSDDVKALYYEDATSEDRAAYFKAWREMFLKKPKIYIEATINNYYQYIYPGVVKMAKRPYEYSETRFRDISEKTAKIGMEFSYPEKVSDYRDGFEYMREYIANLPVLSLSITAATYSWSVLMLLFYAIYKKSGLALSMMGIPLGTFLMCFLGPCNGFFCRYSYPLIVILPVLTVFIMYIASKKASKNIETDYKMQKGL